MSAIRDEVFLEFHKHPVMFRHAEFQSLHRAGSLPTLSVGRV